MTSPASPLSSAPMTTLRLSRSVWSHITPRLPLFAIITRRLVSGGVSTPAKSLVRSGRAFLVSSTIRTKLFICLLTQFAEIMCVCILDISDMSGYQENRKWLCPALKKAGVGIELSQVLGRDIDNWGSLCTIVQRPCCMRFNSSMIQMLSQLSRVNS